MNDLEFDVLDELYFLIPYSRLMNALKLDEEQIKTALIGLFRKGYIRCYQSPTHELFEGEVQLESDFRNYYYLASKEGLMIRHGAR